MLSHPPPPLNASSHPPSSSGWVVPPGRLLGHQRLYLRRSQPVERILLAAHKAAALQRLSLELLEGSIADRARPGAFDAALLWFNTYGFLDDERNGATLSALAAAIRPGGAVIIHYTGKTLIGTLRYRLDRFFRLGASL